jgi:TRAP-type mannitol/chloroaromatic compound transport system permease small subunit
MPSVDFVLPHWLYWVGLIAFPLIAMYLAKRARVAGQRNGYSLGTAYFVLIVGGFLGLHRLYLRNKWGLVFWPLFALILYSSSVEREARVVYSNAVASLELVDSSIARKEKAIKRSQTTIAKAQERLKSLTEGDSSFTRQQKRIIKEEQKITDNRARIEKTKSEVPGFEVAAAASSDRREMWSSISLYSLIAIGLFLLLDLFLTPGMTQKANEHLAANPEEPVERDEVDDDARFVSTGIAGILDRISLFTGEFVAFWSIIAVFTYYYEVVVRYVFNSPTNWAHESMFLMFGMQYLVAGSYAMLTGSHVRVDIFYAKLSIRGKAFVDLLTSIFFFIFAGTLVGTSYIFALDAIGQNEVSFTEWAISYWPIKVVMVLGSLLLLIQGIALVLKDVAILIKPTSRKGGML